MPKKPPTLEDDMLKAITDYDGFEAHRDDWAIAERLVEKGKIELGSARGPGGDFRRATLLEN